MLCLAWKTEGLFKRINCTLLGLLAGSVLFLYLYNPDKFFFILLAMLALGMLFFLLFGTVFIRGRKAAQLAKKHGTYKLSISADGIVSFETDSPILKRFCENKTEFFFSEHVISIKIGKDVYCIPRRVLSERQRGLMNDCIPRESTVRNIKTIRSKS